MLRVVWTEIAQLDLVRLDDYLMQRSEQAASAAMQAIHQGLLPIREFPHAGRPAPDSPPNVRDWPIPFGSGGYVVRYRVDGNALTVLAVRHNREARF